MLRAILLAIAIIAAHAGCSVKPEYKDTKYGSPGGCAREAWQNQHMCTKPPMNKYCNYHI